MERKQVDVLLSVYDGTLCPTTSVRGDSSDSTGMIPNQLEQALVQLSERIPLCIISSKDFAFLHERVRSANILSCALGIETIIHNPHYNDKEIVNFDCVRYQHLIASSHSLMDNSKSLHNVMNILQSYKNMTIEEKREVQRLTEANLQELFELVFIKSEFELHGLRIDTLAFDKESGAFVIIECKKDRNFSVVDQGVAYLNLMLNNKADFILEYIHSFPSQSINKQDVDWSQSRIIFIAPEFTRYQQYAIGFKDLGIQLWEVHKYSNGLLVFNEAKSPFTKEPLTAIAKRNPAAKRITEEIKVYNEEDLLEIAEDKVKELYQELKTTIINLGTDVEVRPTKKYIAFRRNKGFAGIVVLRSKLKVYLNIDISQLQDPLKKARDVKKIGHYSPGDTEIVISERSEISYALSLIKQAYERS